MSSATAAVVCTSGVADDINGDGFADIAVGEPGYNGASGAVRIFYGVTGGTVSVTAPDDQFLEPGVDGIPGSNNEGQLFGWSVDLGDYTGDGCADLAVGVPLASPATALGELFTGKVEVIPGGPGGLVGAGSQTLTLDSLFGAESSRRDDFFGGELSTGDFNDDGIADLVAAAPGKHIVTGVEMDQGAVFVLYGDPSGVGNGATPDNFLSQLSPGVPGTPEAGDAFGTSVSAGDFNGDSVDDLAVGVPGENNDAGLVQVFTGRAGTFLAPGAISISQNTASIPSTSEAGDSFGQAVDAGDVNGDGRADLVVGTPGENAGRGAVTLINGSVTGLTGAGSRSFSQDSPGIAGAAAINDLFGFAVVVAPLDADAFADIAIGVPGDVVGTRSDAGSVNVLHGSGTGPITTGLTRIHQNTTGVPGTAETNDVFGFTVGAAALDPSAGGHSLVVGVPFENVGAAVDAGTVHVFRPGPVAAQSQSLGVSSAEIVGAPGTNEAFGWAVS